MVSPDLTLALTVDVNVTVVVSKLDTVWPPVMARGVVVSKTIRSLAIQAGTLLNVRTSLSVSVASVVTMLPLLAVPWPKLPSTSR